VVGQTDGQTRCCMNQKATFSYKRAREGVNMRGKCTCTVHWNVVCCSMWFSTPSQMAVSTSSVSESMRRAATGSIQYTALIPLAVVPDFESAAGDSSQCCDS
jgi:hypothetical protein